MTKKKQRSIADKYLIPSVSLTIFFLFGLLVEHFNRFMTDKGYIFLLVLTTMGMCSIVLLLVSIIFEQEKDNTSHPNSVSEEYADKRYKDITINTNPFICKIYFAVLLQYTDELKNSIPKEIGWKEDAEIDVFMTLEQIHKTFYKIVNELINDGELTDNDKFNHNVYLSLLPEPTIVLCSLISINIDKVHASIDNSGLKVLPKGRKQFERFINDLKRKCIQKLGKDVNSKSK